jgi:drug/metabolite transporter superfamily protein YnfA
MSPHLFTLYCLVIYGLFATLGCFELAQVIDENRQRVLLIFLFIVNVLFTLLVMASAYASFIEQDQRLIAGYAGLFLVFKIILSSIAADVLRVEEHLTTRIMNLFVVEIVTTFFPVAILLLWATFTKLASDISKCATGNREQEDEEEGQSMPQAKRPLIVFGLWTFIISFLLLGICDIIQLILEDDYLQTLFILFAITNLIFPTGLVWSYLGLEPKEFIGVLNAAYLIKVILASISLYHLIVDTHTALHSPKLSPISKWYSHLYL